MIKISTSQILNDTDKSILQMIENKTHSYTFFSNNVTRSFINKYSGGKKNPDLPIKSTENLNMTCRNCKRLVTIPNDVVLCL